MSGRYVAGLHGASLSSLKRRGLVEVEQRTTPYLSAHALIHVEMAEVVKSCGDWTSPSGFVTLLVQARD